MNRITLTLDSQTYDVLKCNYAFNREVDYRGRPTTGLLGGDIKIEIETTGDDYLWQRLSGRKPRPVSGKLEIFDAEQMSPIRMIEWYDGYIYAVEEGMYSLSAMPMTQKLLITTRRMDINSVVKLDRRFPETYGFWWEEYKEPEHVVVVEEETEEEQEDNTPGITSAAWLDEEDNPITLIPSELEETVTMHIKTTGFDKPENDDEEVLIEIKDEEKNVLFDYTTRPNEEGIIDLDLTIEEIISEKHENPTEYLKEHPNLKLSLFASRLYSPDEKKEAILEKEKPVVTEALFQDEKGSPLTQVPGGDYKYVDIHIKAEKFEVDEEGKCTEPIYFEILDDDKNTLYRSAATLSQNGSCTIGGFDLQGDIDAYLAANGQPALTTRPFSYTLRAWFESNPDEAKEAVIQEEIQCTVYFRRTQKWDGDYFFDWVRMGDTEDPYDKPYNSNIQTPKNGLKRITPNDSILKKFLKQYANFKQNWREKYSESQKNSLYYVPYVKIDKGETVTLRVLLEIEKPSGSLTFEVRDKKKIAIISEVEFDTNSLYRNKITSIKKYINPIKIKCLEEIREITYIDVIAGETLVGQLGILPNKSYDVNAEIIYVSFSKWRLLPKKEDFTPPENRQYLPVIREKVYDYNKLSESTIDYAKKLLRQVNINLKLDIKELNFSSLKEVNEGENKTSFFSRYFINESGEIKTNSLIPKGVISYDKEYSIYDYLLHSLKQKYKNTSDKDFSNKLLIYVFSSQGLSTYGKAEGISYRGIPTSLLLFNVPTNSSDENNDSYKKIYPFHPENYDWENLKSRTSNGIDNNTLTINNTLTGSTTGNNFAHEIIHLFKMEHTFEPPFYICENATDNIMDYIKGDEDERKTLWKWQFEKIIEDIQNSNYPFISY